MAFSLKKNHLLSHPHLQLREHLEQVTIAVKTVNSNHYGVFNDAEIGEILNWAVLFHDVGKSTEPFQKYIENPSEYRGNRKLKQHSLLSMIIFLSIAKEKNLSPEVSLLLAAVIRGHHSRLPLIAKDELGAVSVESHLLDWSRGDLIRLLERQLSLLNTEELIRDLGWSDTIKTIIINLQEQGRRGLSRLNDYFYDLITDYLFSLTEEEAVVLRLKTQYAYSLLLEADKVFLALKEPEKYLDSPARNWEPAWVEQYLGQFKHSKANYIRNNVRQQVLDRLEGGKEERIFSLTAPTGVGKTLLAATWALKMRQKALKKQTKAPKIIVVLPFLSVIEQTAQEYLKILKTGGEKATGAWMIQSHSLAERCYGEDGYEQGDEVFYLDTWKSELIITTYDQLLLSLTAPESRYQMRFHNLCNAIIVLDEVQSLPCRLWYPLDRLFSILAEKGNSYFLLMSATLPPFVQNAQPLLPNYQKVFQQFDRYRFSFQLDPCSLEDFCVCLQNKRDNWLKARRRILITLNTRNSAREVRDCLASDWPEKYKEIPLFFLSADVTPKDRLSAIEKIKEGKPCLVVSTQCIEAGVDMDMQEVYRDFAPLDSLIQIAGRCNRNWNPVRGNVNIVNLLNERGRSFAKMVYDEIHLVETYRLLEGLDSLQEGEILSLAEQFFSALAEKKNTGEKWLSDFAYWQDCEAAREILRGKNVKEHQFLVLKQDPELLEAMEQADSLEGRWARREAWRKLAGRLAQVSVRIRSQKCFHPGWYGEPYHNYWLLNDRFYETEKGILIQSEHNGFIV